MSKMTKLQRNLARAALGLPNPSKQSFRNRYFTPADSPQHAEWRALCTDGKARLFKAAPGQTLDQFCLTKVGALEALDLGEVLDHEDFPT